MLCPSTASTEPAGNASSSMLALPALDPFVIPVWLVAHREFKTSRRVRLVYDLLASAPTTSPLLSSPAAEDR